MFTIVEGTIPSGMPLHLPLHPRLGIAPIHFGPPWVASHTLRLDDPPLYDPLGVREGVMGVMYGGPRFPLRIEIPPYS